jgi:hypothetical protein
MAEKGSGPFSGSMALNRGQVPEQGVGCVWKNFRPSQIAADIAVRTYVDIGIGVDANRNLIRPEIFPDTSHTLLLHREAETSVNERGSDPCPQ